ncbi:MAG: carboxypeptidase regulatory-like domain-containing protein, partial [Thermoanaerobaculia bacterium]|nr:carboxypeptidase regulatory-like domain-containing protein [Thermoanaerobaculia bacterium]
MALLPQPSLHGRGLEVLAGEVLPAAVAATTSGDDGAFRLAAPVGFWTVRVESPGRLPMRHDVGPLLWSTRLAEVRLPPAEPLPVSARDSRGESVAGAWVLLGSADPGFWSERRRESEWGPARRLARTDGAGAAVLPRAADERVRVWAAAAGLDRAPAAESAGDPVTLALPPGVEREIRLRGPHRRPLSRVVVRSGREAPFPVAVTDDAGRASLVAPPDGDLFLAFDHPGGGRSTGLLPAREAPADGAAGADETGPDEPAIFDLEFPPTIAGQVVDAESREPLSHALVWTNMPGEHVETDSGGRFEIAVAGGDARTLFWLQAAAPDHFPGYTRTRAGDPVTVALEAATRLRGRVVDATGEPLAGAELRAEAEEGFGRSAYLPDGATAASDAEGRFLLAPVHPRAGHRIAVSLAGYATLRQRLPSPEQRGDEELLLVLTRGARAVGRILGPGGEPIAEAEIELHEARASDSGPWFVRGADPSRKPVAAALSGGDGGFELADLPPGRFDLEVRSPGYAEARQPGIEVPDEPAEVDLGVLELIPGADIEGLVVDADGRPVPEAEIRLLPSESASRAIFRRLRRGRVRDEVAAVSGPDGGFRVEDLHPGEIGDLLVSAAGHATARLFGIEAPTAQPLRVELAAAARLAGRVLDPGGGPIEDARVHAQPLSETGARIVFRRADSGWARTDADGRFELEVDPGRLAVTVNANGWQGAQLSEIDAPPGGSVTGLEIVLRRGASIVGRIVGGDGRPVSGAQVMTGSGGGMSSSGTTDGDGRYRLEGVETGWQTLRVWHDRLPRITRQVEVEAGENVVDISLEEGFEISGRVVDETGAAVDEATVLLSEESGFDHRHMVTGPDGSFRFDQMLPGTYDVSVQARGFAPRQLDEKLVVDRGPVLGLSVALRRGHSVVGTIFGLAPEELRRVEVRAQGPGALGEVRPDGTYRIDGLPAGSLQVIGVVAGGAGRAQTTVTIVEGVAETLADLEFGVGLTLSGRVLRAGEPLPGARIFLSGSGSGRYGQAASDHDGRFRIGGLEPGSYVVTAIGGASGGLLFREELELQTDRELEISVAGVQIAGRVLDATTYEPLPGVEISISSAEADPGSPPALYRGGAWSDSRGLFRLADLAEGLFRLRATKEGFAPAEVVLTLTAGLDHEDVELRLEPTAGLGLLVLTESGVPARQIDVALLDPGGRVVAGGRLTADGEGRVRLATAPPGVWELRVTSGERGVATQRAAVPDSDVPVTLRTGARLLLEVPDLGGGEAAATARLFDAGGRPFSRLLWGGNLLAEWGVRDGRAQIDGLPAGEWT